MPIAFCPGAIDTAWTDKETGLMDAGMEETTVIAALMGRCGIPEKISTPKQLDRE